MKKYLRNVAVTVARAQPDVFFTNPSNTNAIVMRNVRMKFKIVKSLAEDPNTGEIEIYNLAPNTRAEVERKPLFIRLEAGYANELTTVMAGDLTLGYSEHVGADWITKIQFAEGERAFVNARVNKSLGAGTNAKTAVSEIAKSMGLKIPSSVAEAKELAGQFVSGLSLTGPSRAQMTKVLRGRGMTWSMQNGALQILRANGVRPDQAIVISAETGMIDRPSLAAPKEPGDPVTMKCKTLLDAGIVPGGRVQLISEGVNGLFRVDKVTFTADTRGKECFSEVEGSVL